MLRPRIYLIVTRQFTSHKQTTDGDTDTHIDRQTYRQENRQTGGSTDRQKQHEILKRLLHQTTLDKQLTTLDKQLTTLDKQLTTLNKRQTTLDRQLTPYLINSRHHQNNIRQTIDNIRHIVYNIRETVDNITHQTASKQLTV